jgi:predicted nucleotidyltransferase
MSEVQRIQISGSYIRQEFQRNSKILPETVETQNYIFFYKVTVIECSHSSLFVVLVHLHPKSTLLGYLGQIKLENQIQ